MNKSFCKVCKEERIDPGGGKKETEAKFCSCMEVKENNAQSKRHRSLSKGKMTASPGRNRRTDLDRSVVDSRILPSS